MSNRLNGVGSLNYMGVNATQPPNLISMDRRPTVTDGVGMPLGTIWLIPQAATGITPQKEIWQLVGNRQNVYRWKHLRGSSGPTPEPFAISVSVYDTPGAYTYTPTDGMIQATVECVGGGGGSAGYYAIGGSGNLQWGAGGGGGAYCKKTFSAAQIGSSQALVVGDGGAGGPNATGLGPTFTAGENGGDTTFGSLLSAGGGGGSENTFSTAPTTPVWGGVGGTATGGTINISGQTTLVLMPSNNGVAPLHASGGSGGNSAMGFGFGGPAAFVSVTHTDGTMGTGYGAGGGGVYTVADGFATASATGAAGTGGLVIITEYL